MGDASGGRIPIWGDVGDRFAGRLDVGADGEIAPLVVDEKLAGAVARILRSRNDRTTALLEGGSGGPST